MWRSKICSAIGVTGGCRLYSLAARATPELSADASIGATQTSRQRVRRPTSSAHPFCRFDAIHAVPENVNDAQKRYAAWSSALTRVARRQYPTQIARNHGALLRGQLLPEPQRFAAVTQPQTADPVAGVGFDLEPGPKPVELELSPESATIPFDDDSIALHRHLLPIVGVALDPAERPATQSHLHDRVRQPQPRAEGTEGQSHTQRHGAQRGEQRPACARAQRIVAPRDRAELRPSLE